ncbi:PepSY-like domain-containing protein [Apibacter sp. HY039]|uniref:PepSY-like domain-containing protein n=1 Tax=Apibacter sp. HY039 TaxID=2501476 RepID=UPI000FEBDC52|nr:PepSY-like domain-containing protein [Apibacter sp. HY039]
MKKLIIPVLAVVCFTGVFAAGTSSVLKTSEYEFGYFKNPYFSFISPSQLPASAQNYLNTYFGGLSNVSRAKVDRHKYEVETRDGFEIKFNLDGSVRKIESDYKSIPMGTLSKLPGNVYSYMSTQFAGWNLLKVEIKSSKIELDLEKGRYEAEVRFNGAGKLIKVKYDD